MSMKVIGLIKILDLDAFEAYRSQVGDTVARYSGSVEFRGEKKFMPWNELGCQDFDACVILSFPTPDLAQRWAVSPEYASLLSVRGRAMTLTLFGVH
ncbi:MAG: DUF1330 domain-containing protein [Chitinophagia bacterium]|nr:DUF1330 domain-containing protein [Chitinophagia bacterium]